jgi:flagella basal body P-ring formation protein FlgA
MFAFSIFAYLLLGPHVSSKAEGIGPETDALFRAVKEHVAAVTSWSEPEIEVRSVSCLNEPGPLNGNMQYRVAPNASVTTLRSLVLPMEALSKEKVLRTFWVQAEIRIHITAVQAARRLTYGSVISRADIKMAPTEVSDLHSDYIRNCDLVLGKVLRRTLSPGDPLTRDSVANPVLIRNGEMVRLLFRNGPISLAAAARAEQNGRIGQVIRVRNMDFPKTVKALVTGRGEVRIE